MALGITVTAMVLAGLPGPQLSANTLDASAGGVPVRQTQSGITVQKFGGIVYKNTTTYDGAPLSLKLDIYVPQGPGMSGPWPAMVMLHGGGWADGTRSDVSAKAQDFAALGFVTYTIEFRESCDPLDPASGDDPTLCGFIFDTQEQDIYDAIAWIRANAPLHPEWETMPNAVALWGTSSGANMAGSLGDGWTYCQCVGDPAGPGRPDAVVAWSGPYDLVNGTGSPDTPGRVASYLGCHPYDDPTDCPDGQAGATLLLDKVSPVFNVSADDPPAFIMSSLQDPIEPYDQHALPWYNALQAARAAPDDLYTIPGACHGEKCTVADPNLEANNAAWLHQALGPRQPTVPIQTGPSSSTPLAEATFTFVSGADVSTECALDSAPLAPCTSPVSFGSLPPGQHTFTVVATDGTGTGDPSIYPWTIVPRTVSISDSGFTPSSLTSVTPGSWVQWTNNGTVSHTVTDSSGMSLFDSGPIGAGQTFSQLFVGAGVYNYTSTSDGSFTGSVKVAVQISPKTVSPGQSYTVTWAGEAPPAGYAYDVQYEAPGATKWTKWLTGVTTLSDVVTTTTSTAQGKWSYRARIHNQTTGITSVWSSNTSVTVTVSDTTPPTVTITSGPASPTTDTSATFTYSADEPSTFTCSINSAPYASCAASGVTYSALPYGSNSFGVKAIDLAGNVSTPVKVTWYVSRTSDATVSDTGFSTISRLAMGTTLTWTNIGAAQHTVTDKRLGLFDSGPVDPGGTCAFFFNGASTYTVMSTLDAFPTQQIPVRPTVSPSSGTTTTSFTVTWAAMTPPPDLLFDVYVKRPGATQFVRWQLGATGTSAQFIPDAGSGKYTFYARMRNIADVAEGNSPQVSISVS